VELRRTTPAARRAEDPCMIVDFSHYLHRFHYASTRAAQGVDELAGAQQLIDRYEQIWESASPVHVGRPAGL
jgi:hypothetical protein